MAEVEKKTENLVYAKPKLITDNVMHYCPGCSHGTVHKLIAEVIEEMGLAEKTVGISPVGCSVFAYNYIDIDWIEAAHGRALAVACQNAVRHDVRQRLQPVRADFTRPLLRPESLDLLVSNPPYVGKTEYEGLSAEVRDFEPVTALVPNFVDSDKIPSHDHHHDHGGSHSHAPSTPPDKPEGLEHLIAVAQEAFVALKPGGLLLMEHGCAQGAAIKVLLESHNWENILILKDLSGHDRVASARKPAA